MTDAPVERPAGLRPNQKSANSCDSMREHGHCKFGDDCYYAHSQEESELFAQWARTVKRQQGGERAPPDRYFRTQICTRWREGTCRNGAACTFAHGEEFLRAPRPRPMPEAGSTPTGGPRWEDRPQLQERPATGGGYAGAAPTRPRNPPLCRYWHEQGNCRNGDQCHFMHGERNSSRSEDDISPPPGFDRGEGEPLRRNLSGWECPPEKYKTQLCVYFMEQGYCRHGERCNFAHGMQELPMHRREAIMNDEDAYRGPPGGPGSEVHPDFYDSWGAPLPRRPSAPIPASRAAPAPPPPASEALPVPQSPTPSGSSSLGPSASAELAPAAQRAVPQEAYNPLALLGLPSLASSDGAVALSDDDFPPLGGCAPSSLGASRLGRANGSQSSLAPLSVAPVATAAGTAGGVRSAASSGGPSTPARAAQGAAAPGSTLVSPSDAARPASAPARSNYAAVMAPPPAAAAPASYPPSVEDTHTGYQGGAGGSSSGYETAEEVVAAADPAAAAGLVPAPELVPAPAAAEAPMNFLVPSSPRAQQQPPVVAVTFSPPAAPGVASPTPFASPVPLPLQQYNPLAAAAAAAAAPPAAPSPPAKQQQLRVQAQASGPGLEGGPGSPAVRAQRPARLGSSSDGGSVAPSECGSAGSAAAPTHPPQLAPAAPVAVAMPAVFGVGSIHSLRCPLSKMVYLDPVMAADGYTYERSAIQDWLHRRGEIVSPMTGQPLAHRDLAPNMALRSVMAELTYLLPHCSYMPPALPPHMPLQHAAPAPAPAPVAVPQQQ